MSTDIALQAEAEECGVLIVGAGFSGLCIAARLAIEGRRDFLLIEKGDSVGGTWRDNRYPGCACDIPSHLYSLSFGPRPRWSRHYPTQPELRAYLENVSRYYDLGPNLRLNTRFEDARWNADTSRWIVRTGDGREFRADMLISAVGALHVPEKPALRGIDDFAGRAFHSAEWPEDYDPAGRAIAVVGTGASAIQFVPRIARSAARVTVFQRTAPWVLPKFDRRIGPIEQWLLAHMPGYRRLFRAALYWFHEARLLAFVGRRWLGRGAQLMGRKVIERAVPPGDLRAKVTPDYQLGCKRTLLSNDYYPALRRDTVDVETAAIDRIEADGIVTGDGRRIAADTIIYGTGFKVVESLMALDIRGRGGLRLGEAWRAGPAAFMGITVPDFPNFFLMLGPNTGLGHNSQVVMIEAQADHIIRAMRLVERQRAASIEVTAQAHADFDRDTQHRLRTSVWSTGGCRSWYQDATGRVVALWPRSTFTYARRCARVGPHAYRLSGTGDAFRERET